MKRFICIAFMAIVLVPGIYAQNKTNYDESKIPPYKLPELMITSKGEKVVTANEWSDKRRPEILGLFETYVYGKIPGKLSISSFKIEELSSNALGGKAVRKQVALNFRGNKRNLKVNLLIYLPKSTSKVPVFVGYNFGGNQTVTYDPAVYITDSWIRNDSASGIFNNHATEKSRGNDKISWQVEKIISSGYGLITLYYGDVDPDKNDFTDGVHPLLYKRGQSMPEPDEWGSISAWAWGLGRVMDYIEKDSDIDASKVVVMGHSRLGKTALWTGTIDQRFAIVISNNSGCGGAALSRRIYGETLGGMDQYFPHWLCDNCNKYDNDVDALPVDQHMLIALIAPRPVYIASAENDKWADPKGEYLSGYYASPVYELYGKKGLTSAEMPPVNSPQMNTIGYHIRTGGHDVLSYDWEQFIRFADKHFGRARNESSGHLPIEISPDRIWLSDDHGRGYTYGLNVKSPWENGGILFINFPEHLEYNPVGNTILRHWDSIPKPWIISPDKEQASYRVESKALKDVIVESFVRIVPVDELPVKASGVKLSMVIINNGSETLPVIRPLICMQYSGLAGFPQKLQRNFEHSYIMIDGKMTPLSELVTDDPGTTFKGCVVKNCPQHDTRSEKNGGLITKDMDLALSMVTSTDNKRKVIIWWTPGKSMIANANIPCLHADPYFGTLKPGEKTSAEGMILFTEEDPSPIINFLIAKDLKPPWE